MWTNGSDEGELCVLGQRCSAVLSHMQHSCIRLIHSLVLTPLQNFKTCPKRSLLLIQPVYVRLQTQRFSTGAGNAGTEFSLFLHKM